MRGRSTTVILVALVVLTATARPASAAPPVPGPQRALFGGPLNLQAREPALGRRLDVVRIYTVWETGPTLDRAALASLTAGGARTLLISTSIPWDRWRDTATARNRDGDPGNDLPVPWCKTRPVVPGTATPSGKTWFQAVADGDYDAALRSWLEQVEGLAADVPEIYVTFQHEPDRLSDNPINGRYQRCAGTAAEYRAAWMRLRAVGDGTTPAGGPDLDAGQGGHLRWVPIFTTWGFWHTAGDDGSPVRALVNQSTGQPPADATGDDLTLASGRATRWLPPAAGYDLLGTDVFNYSGSTAGGGGPRHLQVDDATTSAKEPDRWRSLEILTRPVVRWATYNAQTPTGGVRPLVLAEYGSLPDPTRPYRRAAWLGAGCRFLSSVANTRFVVANYFDVNQMRLVGWNWTKAADGSWSATAPTGDDGPSIRALAAVGSAPRFGGTGACPP